jgi:hypothetical protein
MLNKSIHDITDASIMDVDGRGPCFDDFVGLADVENGVGFVVFGPNQGGRTSPVRCCTPLRGFQL